MADITFPDNRRKTAGVRRAKKLSTKVDLTPMVDLGFLLITFFIFTTSMADPKVMDVTFPNDKGKPTDVKANSTLTLLLLDKHEVYAYKGKYYKGKEFIRAKTNEVRKVILEARRTSEPKFFNVVIKPGHSSSYKDIVDVLDEISINNVKNYALVDITADERAIK